MAIIAISGKIGSGKDTIGKIIQWLTGINSNIPFKEWLNSDYDYEGEEFSNSPFKTKKFADKLKDIVCLLIGCTREQLEDREFKEKELGEEWWKEYEELVATESDGREITSLKYNKLTPRKLMQLLGTECGREIIHPNIWVNALFSNYVSVEVKNNLLSKKTKEASDKLWQIGHLRTSNWIITDMRFPNELKAVKDRSGISIRVNRDFETIGVHQCFLEKSSKYEKSKYLTNEHPSETALDNAKFDYVIDNNGTIEELIIKVKEILIKENVL